MQQPPLSPNYPSGPFGPWAGPTGGRGEAAPGPDPCCVDCTAGQLESVGSADVVSNYRLGFYTQSHPFHTHYQEGLQPKLLQSPEGAELAIGVSAFMAAAMQVLLPHPSTGVGAAPPVAQSGDLPGTSTAAAAAISRLRIVWEPLSWSMNLMETLPTPMLWAGAVELLIAALDTYALIRSVGD